MRAVRIETSPFQILSLVEFESILKKNQHGCAKISGYISAEEKNRIMAMIYRGFENPCRGGHIFIDGTFKNRDRQDGYGGAYWSVSKCIHLLPENT